MQLVTRGAWGARPPAAAGNAISPTALGTAIHYEGPAMGIWDHTACAHLVAGIQAFHMDVRGWADIAYSFLACPHEYVFEGRGYGRGSAANGSLATNYDWYAVCLLTGQGDPITPGLLGAGRDAVDLLRGAGNGPGLCGHKDLNPATACPGEPLYSWAHAGCPRPGDPAAPTTPAGPIQHPNVPTPHPGAPPAAQGSLEALVASLPLVKKDTTGQPARNVQGLLVAHGFTLAVDGVDGAITTAAVVAFQTRRGLSPDGEVGPITWGALVGS